MNINTTLLIFAVLAVFGLITALMLVQPNVAKASIVTGGGEKGSDNKFKACDNTQGHPNQPPFCRVD